ncbi:MAG: flippase-like domain-containing protein [SAR202 cluster bacterium]|nr:flippase-like domain-containing protein [SAR202 cluster bacterium]|tara:strand:+ start:3112 stop:4128 length:1017 start_codon:yes stop_codon:yes gene_type:complete
MEYNHSQNTFDLVAKILSWQTFMSFAIAIGLLTLVIAKVDIDWANTKATIFKSNIPVYLLAFISYYFGFLLRGWRWSIMIENSDRNQNLRTKDYSIFQCSLYVYLGWFANTVTWFRLGDVYRAYIFSQDNKDSFSRVIGTILSERVLDIATVFFVLVLAFSMFYGSVFSSGMFIFIGLSLFMFIIGLAGIFVMRRYSDYLITYMPRKFRKSYQLFHDGVLGSLNRMYLLIFLSIIIWSTEVLRLFLVIQALHLSTDPSVSLILFVTLVNAILTTVPITPGGVGVVEPGIVGLISLSMSRSEAISVAILDRSISYLSIVILGTLVFLGRYYFRQKNSAP